LGDKFSHYGDQNNLENHFSLKDKFKKNCQTFKSKFKESKLFLKIYDGKEYILIFKIILHEK
jgi:hypothetical protein